jgi:hypothetical protein
VKMRMISQPQGLLQPSWQEALQPSSGFAAPSTAGRQPGGDCGRNRDR